ncbi:MAG: CoA-binding protein [Planctomycetota bacterium]|nr:CoA-binding protein [Planctomycetota bacterium]
MTIRPTVAVVGASRDRSKYGNISVRAHLQQGYEVFPVNPNADEIEGLAAFPTLSDVPIDGLDRVTIYLPPNLTLELLDEILKISPTEVWLNPGSADEDVRHRAKELGIEIIEACSIVDLGVSPYAF